MNRTETMRQSARRKNEATLATPSEQPVPAPAANLPGANEQAEELARAILPLVESLVALTRETEQGARRLEQQASTLASRQLGESRELSARWEAAARRLEAAAGELTRASATGEQGLRAAAAAMRTSLAVSRWKVLGLMAGAGVLAGALSGWLTSPPPPEPWTAEREAIRAFAEAVQRIDRRLEALERRQATPGRSERGGPSRRR